jgi:FkbM family methyltransferase
MTKKGRQKDGLTRAVVHSFAMDLDLTEAIQRSMYDATYEPTQTAWVSGILAPGNRFVDIGASFGHYTTLARQIVGEQGSVFAFEPSPVASSALAKLIAENGISNIELVCAAVGHQSGQIDLQLPINGPVHSPSVFYPAPDFIPTRVPMMALDDFSALNDGRVADLVKIDVEGFEPNVIAGMQGLIRRGIICNMMCEFNSGWLRHNSGMTPQKSLDSILSLGFSIRDKTDKATGLERETA